AGRLPQRVRPTDAGRGSTSARRPGRVRRASRVETASAMRQGRPGASRVRRVPAAGGALPAGPARGQGAGGGGGGGGGRAPRPARRPGAGARPVPAGRRGGGEGRSWGVLARRGGRRGARGGAARGRLDSPARPDYEEKSKSPGPHRLAAQDIALSRLRQGFESPWGYLPGLREFPKPFLFSADPRLASLLLRRGRLVVALAP